MRRGEKSLGEGIVRDIEELKREVEELKKEKKAVKPDSRAEGHHVEIGKNIHVESDEYHVAGVGNETINTAQFHHNQQNMLSGERQHTSGNIGTKSGGKTSIGNTVLLQPVDPSIRAINNRLSHDKTNKQ